MDEVGVRRVAQILEIELPIAVIGVLEDAARDLDRAVGRAVHHVVEGLRHGAEEILEAHAVRRQAGEDEAAIDRHARHRQHRKARIGGIEIAGIAVQERRRFEPAVGAVGPAVIAAAELARMTRLGGHHHGAAMGALVVQHADGAVVVPHHEERPEPDPRREEVARLRHLALVPDIDPGAAENALHLEREDLGIGVERAMHPAGPEALAQACGFDVHGQ